MAPAARDRQLALRRRASQSSPAPRSPFPSPIPTQPARQYLRRGLAARSRSRADGVHHTPAARRRQEAVAGLGEAHSGGRGAASRATAGETDPCPAASPTFPCRHGAAQMIRAGALIVGQYLAAARIQPGHDDPAVADRSPRPARRRVHAPLGEVEWPDTIEFIRATLPPGVPLIFAPVASGKTLLEQGRGTRPVWPSRAKLRWCTSSISKRPDRSSGSCADTSRPIRASAGGIVNAMGMRAEESVGARAEKSRWRLQRPQLSVAGRDLVFDWLPIFDLSDRGRVPTSSATPASRRIGPTPHGHVEAESCSVLHPGVPRRSAHGLPELQPGPLCAATRRLSGASATRCHRRASSASGS